MTFKVPDLHAALDVLAGAGLDAVDINDDNDFWKEAFLRPSQVGGLVVQIATTPYDDDDWAALTNFTREKPREHAADLLGPLLRHPDLERAYAVWTALGAQIERRASSLRCTWPHSPLDVVIEQGTPAGPTGVRMRGTGDIPAVDGSGPAVIDVAD